MPQLVHGALRVCSTRGSQSKSLVCVQTVIRCTSNRRQIEPTLSPFARAVRIASTCLSVRGVLARLLGFATTPGSSSPVLSGSSPIRSFAWFQAELSRSNRCQVFGLSPAASTNHHLVLCDQVIFCACCTVRQILRSVKHCDTSALRRKKTVFHPLRVSERRAGKEHTLLTTIVRL